MLTGTPYRYSTLLSTVNNRQPLKSPRQRRLHRQPLKSPRQRRLRPPGSALQRARQQPRLGWGGAQSRRRASADIPNAASVP
jgi:hypothetical protein